MDLGIAAALHIIHNRIKITITHTAQRRSKVSTFTVQSNNPTMLQHQIPFALENEYKKKTQIDKIDTGLTEVQIGTRKSYMGFAYSCLNWQIMILTMIINL